MSLSSVLTQLKGLFSSTTPDSKPKQEPSAPDSATSATRIVSDGSKPSGKNRNSLVLFLSAASVFSESVIADSVIKSEALNSAFEALVLILACIGLVAVAKTVFAFTRKRQPNTERQGVLSKIPVGIRASLFEQLPVSVLRQIARSLTGTVQRRLIAGADDSEFSAILEKLEDRDITAVFTNLSLDYQKEIVASLPPDLHEEILKALPTEIARYYLASLGAKASGRQTSEAQPSKATHLRVVKADKTKIN